jgi:hypothetical protein
MPAHPCPVRYVAIVTVGYALTEYTAQTAIQALVLLLKNGVLRGNGGSCRSTLGESTMATLLGGLVFAAFLLAQIAAVVAIHAARRSRGSDALEATRHDPRVRVIWESGG